MTTIGTLQRTIVLAVCTAVAAPGCASARWSSSISAMPAARQQAIDPVVLSEYIQKLPLGTTIRVDRVEGKSLRGTLIKVSDRSLIVQPRTRIPEPAAEIPLSEILRVTPEQSNGGNIAKAIGIGAAAGAGAALAVFFIIIAAYGD